MYYIALGAMLIIGIIFGAFIWHMFRGAIIGRRARIAERKAARIVADAEIRAKGIMAEGKQEIDKIRASSEAESRERRIEIQRQENRLSQKLENLERKLESVEHRERNLINKEKAIDATHAELEDIKAKQLAKLEQVSNLTTADAKQQLLDAMETEMQQEASRRLYEWEIKIKGEASAKAQDIIIQAVQRCASEITGEITASTVPIPNDEMKGRLIGREGRNIRALEQATGVDLIIDDTPEAVTLSSFDPIRREIARLALSKLITDGRIHPARIEEVVAKAKEEVDTAIQKAGEEAAYRVGLHGLRPELLKLLGRLKYRTSYGQNVLEHSVEVAFMSGMIASELGINPTIAKRAGLLHDIGKAVDREVEGTHAQIGADLVKQWDKSPEVIQGIAEHHMETGSTSMWGYLVSAADAISSARPGARRETLENYLKRLKDLEDIANSFSGVDKSYAIQAGREIRILVKPEEVDDMSAMRLARDIVKKIEEGMEYPGQIKVTVLRETRAVEIAK
ncbi:MAG: ribonuclease Y [Dehalococcoidales bacterium]|nr:ribonuclease Y [Dehalococcoidales bacterium]